MAGRFRISGFSPIVNTVAVLIATVLLTSHAPSATIRMIQTSGNSVFTSRELLEAMSSRAALAYSPSILQNDINSMLEKYHRAGYLDVVVGLESITFSNDSSMVDLRLAISEGRQAVLDRFVISGQRQFTSAEITSWFDVKVGEPLDAAELEQDIDELLSRYERSGFPLTQCSITEVERRKGGERDSLDLTLQIVEGPRVTIDEIQVQGNKETDAAVVVRETRLQVGETFNPVKVDAIRQRLQRLNIFSDVSEPELYTRNDRGGLLIKVREGNTNTFDGVIGYIPSPAPDQSGYVTGLASISMRNLFGTGRKLSVNWQREDRNTQELGLRYVEPWVLGAPVNLGGGFLQRQQDTSYVRRVFDLKGELMFSEELSASLLFGSESIIPSADASAARVFRCVTTTFGVEVQYDTRDDIYSPTSGARYRTDYSFGNKHTRNVPPVYAGRVPRKSTVQRFTLDLDFYITTFVRQVIAFGLHGKELRSGQYEEGELFRLGGTRTLRGYRENQFIGSRIAWSNFEYRLLLARRSFLYGFLDGGYYLRPGDEIRNLRQTSGFKYGYGFGVQLETGLGNLGVSFALGQGDSFGTGKIHFGLINEF